MIAQPPLKNIYTVQFGLLCLSSFLFFMSFNMIVPELPDYLSSLGGEDYKGLIIALFTLTAGLSRPFSGKLADLVGRIPVMVFGASVCFVAGMLYPFLGTVIGFLILRFFHGFSTGFAPTGTSAYVADIVPDHKRGEAMGLIGISGSAGMATGPAIGPYIAHHYTLDAMFYTSAAFSIFSVIILLGMKETLAHKRQFKSRMLRISKYEIFEPNVFTPAIVMLLTVFSFGIVLTIAPDMSKHLGIAYKGLFFTYFTIASISVRFFAGKASDRFGRVNVLKVSSFVLCAAMVVIGLAKDSNTFFVGAILYGLANGMNTPTIFAWGIDLSHEQRRGKAMATLYIFLEIGIGTGALLAAYIYGNNTANFDFTFWSGAVLALLALIFLFVGVSKEAYR